MTNSGSKVTAPAVEATAYHEAGHAVMAMLLGRKVHDVSIVGDQATVGRVRVAPIGPSALPAVPLGQRKENLIRKYVQVLWAGWCAEKIAFDIRDDDGASHDLEVARALLTQLSASDAELEAWLQLLRIRTEAQLRLPFNWGAVDQVARALLAQRRVGARRLRTIMRSSAGFGLEPPPELNQRLVEQDVGLDCRRVGPTRETSSLNIGAYVVHRDSPHLEFKVVDVLEPVPARPGARLLACVLLSDIRNYEESLLSRSKGSQGEFGARPPKHPRRNSQHESR